MCADHLVVGIGASAGGLGAISQVLEGISGSCGHSFVVVQHLAATHESLLAELLSRETWMRVSVATDGAKLEPGQVLVIPHDADIEILEGAITLHERPVDAGPHLPINRFFRSMAENLGARAVGIVLSGSGSDGTEGLLAIREKGGKTIAQAPETAGVPEMPRSAIERGAAELTLSPARIAKALNRSATAFFADTTRRGEAGGGVEGTVDQELLQVFRLLFASGGVDFSTYKQSTIRRRITRRMLLSKTDSVQGYLEILRDERAELEALFSDLLIGVTSFFRDQDAFAALRDAMARWFSDPKIDAEPARIWVPGCSTGEEAYTIAICAMEAAEAAGSTRSFQVFGTDVSESAIEHARQGVYDHGIAENVDQARLQRYFRRGENGFRIAKALRERCVFARQNLVRDPPFSRLDLISCRNLMIYLGHALQRRVFPTLHFALNPGGLLMLGSSEAIGEFADLFALLDRKHKIYAKRTTGIRTSAEASIFVPSYPYLGPATRETPAVDTPDLGSKADEMIAERFGPCGVVVDPRMQIIHFRGRTGRYLEPAPGAAALSLLSMVRPGLLLDLRRALLEARRSGRPARAEGVAFSVGSEEAEASIEVIPLEGSDEDTSFLVIFEENVTTPAAPADNWKSLDGEARAELQRLHADLDATRSSLRTVIEESEASSEELMAANEEVQSSNEELQSINEELETAKEELQSANEELTTLNEELETRNHELGRAADDLDNIFTSIEIPIVILGSDLLIRSLTPLAKSALGMREGDLGRPLSELRLGLEGPDLSEIVADTRQSLAIHDVEARNQDGSRWYSIRSRPYRTSDDKIDGVILAFVDITEAKRASAELETARALARDVIDKVQHPLAVLDEEQRIVLTNRSFDALGEVQGAALVGEPLEQVGDGFLARPELLDALRKTAGGDRANEGLLLELSRGRKRLELEAELRALPARHGRKGMILLSLEVRSES